MNNVLGNIYHASGGDVTSLRLTPIGMSFNLNYTNLWTMNYSPIDGDPIGSSSVFETEVVSANKLTYIWNFDDPYWSGPVSGNPAISIALFDNSNIIVTQSPLPIIHYYYYNGVYFPKLTIRLNKLTLNTVTRLVIS